MPESKSLSLRGIATKALLLLKKGANREIAVCDEEQRPYLMNGVTPGGKAIAMLNDFEPATPNIVVWSGKDTSPNIDVLTWGAGHYLIKVARNIGSTSFSYLPITLLNNNNYQCGGYAPLFNLSIRTYNDMLFAFSGTSYTEILEIKKVSDL